MFRPSAFDLTDTETLHTAVDDYSFATMVMGPVGDLDAVHLPLILDREKGPLGSLRGHVARANPLWKSFDGSRTALCIFHGPHAYITPRWYRDSGQVPTWNYLAVHVYGCPRIVDDQAEVRKLLDDLTAKHEGRAPGAWRQDWVPEDLYARLLGAIVAFDFTIDRLEGKLKMSQNKPEDDRKGVIDGLDALGTEDAKRVADLMRDGS